MSALRPLRGGCQCGRNSYIINLPESGTRLVEVVFDTHPRHRIFQASPLAAYIRVPLSLYSSATLPLFSDETPALIRRTYTQQSTKSGFCGFCGTPLSYWSEDPPSEAGFIRLSLGSLCSEDLGDLEDMGLVPGGHGGGSLESSEGSDEGEREGEGEGEGGGERRGATAATTSSTTKVTTETATTAPGGSSGRIGGSSGQTPGGVVSRETFGVPWIESMVAGSRLGRLRQSRGGVQTANGKVTYEWEVVEWTEGGGDGAKEQEEEDDDGGRSPSKRQKHDGSSGTVPMQM